MDRNIDYPYLYGTVENKEDNQFIVERILFCPILKSECEQENCGKFSDYKHYTVGERGALLAADNPAGCCSGYAGKFCTVLNKPTSMIHILTRGYMDKHDMWRFLKEKQESQCKL